MGRKLQRNLLRLLAISQKEAFAAKVTAGTRGFDFDTLEDDLNGGNIYKDYDEKEL
jgi:hypothetical protein